MFRIRVDNKLCKGCGICIEFCPMKVYDLSEELSERGVRYPLPKRCEKCTGCQLCEIMCPDMAIEVENGDDKD